MLCVLYRPCSKPWSGGGDKPCPMCGTKVSLPQQNFAPWKFFRGNKYIPPLCILSYLGLSQSDLDGITSESSCTRNTRT